MHFLLSIFLGDPDDFLTLLFLGGHPQVDLLAVTVTPGTTEQVHLVRWALQELGLATVPVGVTAAMAQRPRRGSAVNPWHHHAYGSAVPANTQPAEEAADLLLRVCDETVTLITGAPVHNLEAVHQKHGHKFHVGRWVAQGGFAGADVVPADVPWPANLQKFRDAHHSPTFNFGAAAKGVELTLRNQGVGAVYTVGKNVCHRNICSADMLAQIRAATLDVAAWTQAQLPRSLRAMQLMVHGLEVYLALHPNGKKLHDPLAACAALAPGVCTWEEVRIKPGARKGEWGCVKAKHTNMFAAVDFDQQAFVRALTYQN